jgi:hypothetical protein
MREAPSSLPTRFLLFDAALLSRVGMATSVQRREWARVRRGIGYVAKPFGISSGRLLTALTSGKFSGVRPRHLLDASTEVSSIAHVTSARNAPEQTKRPVQDPFSHRETHIVRMTRRAVVFTGKECCFYDSDRPVSEKRHG